VSSSSTRANGHGLVRLVRFARDAPVDVQLFCFPFAGGGAQSFRGWQARARPGVEVTGVSLPGRERGYREPPITTWPDALAALFEAIITETRRGPYAFFGHSLGARLAYELTHRLAEAGHCLPRLLIVSACRAPGVAPRWPPMHSMDGPTLTARLRQMNGVPDEVLANPQLMAQLEPVLRADLKLAETWVASGGRIAVPILALCGEHDDIDPYQDMLGWQHHTAAGFAIQSLPAGHFFLQEQEDAVVAAISAHLAAHLTAR
jgi:medium-chain acyl-[acyl-carrier-protein] hydrolase